MRKFWVMLALIVAGEFVFGLAFHVPRFFRPTMLEVFGFSNTELGDVLAIYGITAVLCYFPGGALADHISARTLMVVSLFATALGGLYLATLPGATEMAMLYGYWGITTIFLMWGALILATREWGGETSQGLAFGLLEGGRGLAAASLSLFAVYVLASFLPDNARLATPEEREAGFRTVVLLYTLATFLTGVFAWFAIPAGTRQRESRTGPLQGMLIVLRQPVVWAQAGIVMFAYCAFKGLDNYSLYAVQVFGMDEVEGARLSSYGAWTRPLAALIAGLIADRFSATKSIAVVFGMLVLFYFSWSVLEPGRPGAAIIYLNFFASYIAAFALRGIYFALLEENRTPKFITGATVGLVSVVGFTPDIFFAPIGGRILDANPGIVGHQNYFLFLAGTALLGLVAALWLIRLHRRGRDNLWTRADG
jgi:MFS transporter, GlpU family, inner membrane protein